MPANDGSWTERSDVATGMGVMNPMLNRKRWKSMKMLAGHMRPRIKSYIDKSIAHVYEAKYYDIPQSTGTPTVANIPSASSNLVDLFAPAQGKTSITRVGDSCRLRYETCLYRVVSAVAAATGARYSIRVIMLQWDSPTTPTHTDILQSVAWNSPINVENQPLINVIYDRIHSMIVGSTSGEQISYFDNWSFAGDGRVNFTAAATSGNQKVWLLTLVDNSTTVPTIDIYHRLEYYD
jgi:hypothetical protein